MSAFKKNETVKAETLINEGWFNGDGGHGDFGGHIYPFVLKDSGNNFYNPILDGVKNYFRENDIAWWHGEQPTGHVLSSQIACINHLFYLRNDREAVLSLLSSFSRDFIDVLTISTDRYEPAYISFEQVSDNDHLNEGTPRRGANCTSLDACIYALHKNGSRWLIPIEWKYTESYGDENKGAGASGETRHKRYDELIRQSSQLIYDKLLAEKTLYYFEPFYQLMRQTLWAEQMVKNKDSERPERIRADEYIHVSVIPRNNADMLEKIYPCSGMDMQRTWKSCLADQNKYKIISPEVFLENLGQKYNGLKQYLAKRYWNAL